jgi:hypothetical protein
MATYDCVVSINVYKMPVFLDQQLANIKEHLQASHAIILNCNDYMAQALKGRQLPGNVYVNHEVINKLRGHGSLLRGIVSNMNFTHNLGLKYKYMIILSGRTVFYKPLTLENLDLIQPRANNTEEFNNTAVGPFSNMDWHWPEFRKTLLGKYYLDQGRLLYGSEHEGLTLHYSMCMGILEFMSKHIEIRSESYTYNEAMEEFVLQTIAANTLCPQNFVHGFIKLGHGTGELCDISAPNKFTKKILYPEEEQAPEMKPAEPLPKRSNQAKGLFKFS